MGSEGLDIDTSDKHHIVRRLGLKCTRAEKVAGVQDVLEEISLVNLHLMQEAWLEPGECLEVLTSGPPKWLERDKVCWIKPLPGSQVTAAEGLVQVDETEDGIKIVIQRPEDEAVFLSAGDWIAVSE